MNGCERSGFFGLAVMLAASSVATSNAAAAEPATLAVDAELTAAKADFEEAQNLYTRELFDGAAAKFLEAYEKKPFAAFLFNAAVAYEKAQKPEPAIAFFEKYLNKDPDAKDAPDVRTRVEGLKAMLARPVAPALSEPSAPPAQATPLLPAIETKGLVIIDSKPPGASIYLNDKTGGIFAHTPWQGSLPPRQVKLIIEAKGFKAEERSISPRTDKVYELYIALSEEHFLGWIEVASNVAGADVFIDRKDIGAIGKTPYTGHVKPGKHTLWIERLGYLPLTKEIEVLPGTATTHMFAMQQVANGWISVVGRDSKGGKLFVDGVRACDTPCRKEATPGLHKVRVKKEGMEDYAAEITVDRSGETSIAVRFSAKPSRSRAWTGSAVGAVFVAGGVYLGLQSRSLRDDLRSDIAGGKLIATSDSRVQKGKYYAIGADALFGLGAVTGVIALINFLSSGPDSTADVDQKPISMAPLVLPGGGGLVAMGRF